MNIYKIMYKTKCTENYQNTAKYKPYRTHPITSTLKVSIISFSVCGYCPGISIYIQWAQRVNVYVHEFVYPTGFPDPAVNTLHSRTHYVLTICVSENFHRIIPQFKFL